jgi:four helix bundle protein
LAYQSFEDLKVWQEACQLAIRVYENLKNCRDYGLRDQMTRAAVSIPSNIAEGAERGSTADFKRFLHIAKGSAAELRTQIAIATQAGLIHDSDQEELIQKTKQIAGMLHGLINSLLQRAPRRET